MEKEITFIQEIITVIRPTTSNHVFNEEKYSKIETYDEAGQKVVLLREKL